MTEVSREDGLADYVGEHMVFARYRCRADLRWTVDAILQILDDGMLLLTICMIETIYK